MHTHVCVVMRDMRGEFTPHVTSERLMLLTVVLFGCV